MPQFAGEHILVTGAASGLGRAMARQLVEMGASVAGLDRAEKPLLELAGQLPADRFAWAVADVTDRPTVCHAVSALEMQIGPLDRLIAAAGVGWATPAEKFDSAEFEEIVRINLIGVANSLAAVLPGMMRRRKGHLVALSSLASFRGLPSMAAYCASKAGVNALFDSFCVELKEHGIRVTTVCPGWVRTPLTAPLGNELPGMMEVEPAVRRILTAIAKQRRFVAFPQPSATLVRVLRWLPPALSDRLLRRVFQMNVYKQK